MSTFLLIRHASHDWMEYGVAGRLQGIHLNQRGQREAVALAGNLRRLPVETLHSSPLARTWETAASLARTWGMNIIYNAAFLEIDFGKWTGRSFASLENDPQWIEWNERRADAHVPGGESMRQVKERGIDELDQLAAHHPGSLLAVVTHGDVIRSILLHCLERSLNDIHEIAARAASVAVVEWEDGVRKATLIDFPAAHSTLQYPLTSLASATHAMCAGIGDRLSSRPHTI